MEKKLENIKIQKKLEKLISIYKKYISEVNKIENNLKNKIKNNNIESEENKKIDILKKLKEIK